MRSGLLPPARGSKRLHHTPGVAGDIYICFYLLGSRGLFSLVYWVPLPCFSIKCLGFRATYYYRSKEKERKWAWTSRLLKSSTKYNFNNKYKYKHSASFLPEITKNKGKLQSDLLCFYFYPAGPYVLFFSFSYCRCFFVSGLPCFRFDSIRSSYSVYFSVGVFGCSGVRFHCFVRRSC